MRSIPLYVMGNSGSFLRTDPLMSSSLNDVNTLCEPTMSHQSQASRQLKGDDEEARGRVEFQRQRQLIVAHVQATLPQVPSHAVYSSLFSLLYLWSTGVSCPCSRGKESICIIRNQRQSSTNLLYKARSARSVLGELTVHGRRYI
jgi:hypothetical protein